MAAASLRCRGLLSWCQGHLMVLRSSVPAVSQPCEPSSCVLVVCAFNACWAIRNIHGLVITLRHARARLPQPSLYLFSVALRPLRGERSLYRRERQGVASEQCHSWLRPTKIASEHLFEVYIAALSSVQCADTKCAMDFRHCPAVDSYYPIFQHPPPGMCQQWPAESFNASFSPEVPPLTKQAAEGGVHLDRD